MGNPFAMRSLLLGFVCLALLTVPTVARPKEIPKSLLVEGCYPFVDQQCPAQMYCLVDLRYKKYGMCNCVPNQLKQLKPPDNTGLELAPLIVNTDCERLGALNWFGCIYWLLYLILFGRLFMGCVFMLNRVKQSGGLKMNSSVTGLIGLALMTLGEVIRMSYFLLCRLNFDPSWVYWDATYTIPSFLSVGPGYWFKYEIICTWFDLFQRSVSMSKRSSSAIKILRIVIRLVGLTNVILWSWSAFMTLPGFFVEFTTFATLFNTIAITGFCTFSAPLLIRALCKDMKNVTHPNWKAAAAIRRVACAEPFAQIAVGVGNKIYLNTIVYANMGGVIGNGILTVMWFYHLYSAGEWFGYMIFAHRRHLNATDTSKISQYFGFTTLGINGSLTSEVLTRLSGKSSASTVEATAAESGNTMT